MQDTILEARDVKKYYYTRGIFGHHRTVYAVDGVDMQIRRGTTAGLVGESGSGKTTLGKTIIGLIPATDGEILFDGTNTLAPKTRAEKREIRRKMQIVFQDPFGSLNPWMTIADAVGRPVAIHHLRNSHERMNRIIELLELVGLDKSHLAKYPHEFSGGQRQRIAVARALACEPEFIVLDEPTSALDVSVQGKILNLLIDLQKRLNLTYLFISHNLAVVSNISDIVAVMYLGKIVEIVSQECLDDTKHPYSRVLLSAVPKANPKVRTKRMPLTGSIPSPANPPPGCKFHTRCPYVVDKCRLEEPPLVKIHDDHLVACHRWQEIKFPTLYE